MFPVRGLIPLALVAALAATACGSATAAPAAHVLGTDVTDDQLATTANVFKALFGLQHAPCGQVSGSGDTQDAACNRYSLGALIQFRLAETYAAQHAVTIANADVQKAIDGFETQVGKDTFAAQLAANGASHDDFTELVRLSLLENEVSKRLALERANGRTISQQDQTEAFAAWVREQDGAGQIDVDPSFGRFDTATLQIVRITSTDPSASTSASPTSGTSPSG
jgi:hypothetical protein